MKLFVLLAAMFALVMTSVAPFGKLAEAGQPEINVGRYSKLAIHGYDPVAYFKEGKPVEGDEAHSFIYKSAKWLFSSAANLEAFKGDPEAYAPQYGGHCAYAASLGQFADADPVAWRVVGGKLYLNYNNRVQRQWENDLDANIVKGDENWPKMLAQ